MAAGLHGHVAQRLANISIRETYGPRGPSILPYIEARMINSKYQIVLCETFLTLKIIRHNK